MEENREGYVSALSARYASKEMQAVFSDNFKFTHWRKLWVSLARHERELGLPIFEEQIKELEENVENINYDVAEEREKTVRHDVMSHVYAYGVQCPEAKGIIHLGATSCFVGDNTDVIVLKTASEILLKKLAAVVKNLTDFAEKYKALPTLGYTHLQPAQPTTVGKRATLWAYDLITDIERLSFEVERLCFLGQKGTTGTQASFCELFGGDEEKVKTLEKRIAADFGFHKVVPVSGQTYSRKTDANFLSVLSGICQSAYKFASDLRLLQSFEEMEEPFEKHQIGSSAMPYKRNPMRAERMCALARYVVVDSLNPALTACVQGFERTLDDSANKRLAVSEAFLATDGVLELYLNITDGLVVNEPIIFRRLSEKLPFMATETVLMEAVKKGKDRQKTHEIIRDLSQEAATAWKQKGETTDLLSRLAENEEIPFTEAELKAMLDPKAFTGLCEKQVEDFIKDVASPVLARYYKGKEKGEVRV